MQETQNSPGVQVVADLHLRIHHSTKNCLQIETVVLQLLLSLLVTLKTVYIFTYSD